MLYIRTGLMGHGKTLNTIKEVDQKAYKEGRPVYFHNVTGLEPDKLQADWFEFDEPHKWFELPINSIVVVDEAQQFFGTRDPRKDVPEYCSRFEIMRKQGHEVHLITQDPRFLDVHARRLCNKHIHYSRIFGSSKLVRYETERCYETVDKFPTNKLADKSTVSLDKKYFGVYSSAQAGHHFKFKPSKKAIFFAFATLVTAFLLFRVFNLFYGSDENEQAVQTESVISQVQNAVGTTAGSLLGTGSFDDKPLTASEYLAQLQPRVPNLPASAPVYDDLTAPQTHPKLFCASSNDPELLERTSNPVGVYNGVRTSCVCYTQQVTRVDVGFQFCMNAVRHGYFDNTRPDRQQQMAQGGYQQQQQYGQHQQSIGSPGASIPGGIASVPDVSTQPVQTTRVTIVPYEKAKFAW